MATPVEGSKPAVKVFVATTVMLTFISFWRAAAIVLADLASSAYYAGGDAEKVIGKSTIPAMQSGLFWGYVGLIEGLIERIRREFGAPMGVVATGGLAPLFAGATPVVETIDTDLTFWGLYLIHQRNKAS